MGGAIPLAALSRDPGQIGFRKGGRPCVPRAVASYRLSVRYQTRFIIACGARRVLVPLENKRNFLEVSGDIVERVDPVFFSDPMTAAVKALGMT